ncbi:HD domain-containing protein [Methanogenium organophilum]|uniref:HD domain-containing protein n=1 Tax=Methanogenium organophilum TaxID=2199 RepID=A0A9X9S5F6_METOG|nr:HD domain-containing protein [Methanogenium organophilum]WAI02057.1 HD domain-containing protein [Methanogenium organophilum]
MEKKFTIQSVADRDSVDDLFVISNADIREGKRGQYITCTISDATGEMACKIWGVNGQNERVQIAYDAICDGMVYRIDGQASVYNGELQMSINDGIDHIAHGPVDHFLLEPGDFVFSPANCTKNREDILRMAAGIGRQGLRDIVERVFATYDSFFFVPAARGKHHAYRGGLAEHTLEVVRYTESILTGTEGITADRDVAVAGALMHDVGKAVCFAEQGFSYSQLPIYFLRGHISPGISIVEQAAQDVGVGGQDLSHLLHIVQTHHGEHGDPKPQTVEAWTVHMADNTSALLHEVASDIEDTVPGEGRFGPKVKGPVFRYPEPSRMQNGTSSLPDTEKNGSQMRLGV